MSDRGRPPLVKGEKTTPVVVRLPSSLHDKACKLASRQNVSVGEAIRRTIQRAADATT